MLPRPSACTGTRSSTAWSGCASRRGAIPTIRVSAWSYGLLSRQGKRLRRGTRSRPGRGDRRALARRLEPPHLFGQLLGSGHVAVLLESVDAPQEHPGPLAAGPVGELLGPERLHLVGHRWRGA